jgi:hypothetical protein
VAFAQEEGFSKIILERFQRGSWEEDREKVRAPPAVGALYG